MKKIYSFVLMAAMLLVGTNAWAGNAGTAAALQQAFQNAQDGDVITVTADLPQVANQLVLNVNGDVVLDLGGHEVVMTCNFASNNAAILVKRGRLTIQNGTISQNGTKIYDLIRLNGSTDEIDAKLQTPYSQVIVKAGVVLENTNANVLTICEATGTNNLANGARIDVYGELNAKKYGIKVNGSVLKPANTDHSPYVWIHAGASVNTSASESNAVAAYSSGYARWLVEGYCGGSTGLYAKGGQIEITGNAKVESTSTNTHTIETGKSSGVAAGGSGVVVESNANYPGQISVVISGNATIEGANGYAIEEKIDNALTETKVESITIQGGNIDGGNAGAIIVEEMTTDGKKVTVVGGDIEGTIEVEGVGTVEEASVTAFLPTGSTHTDPEHQGDDSDYVVATGGTTENPTYSVVPNLSKVVTMNSYRFSTFSTTVDRKIKATDLESGNLKAYTAEYGNGETLTLHEIADGIIPANTGIILYGQANATYTFDSPSAIEGTEDIYSLDNNLEPATAWDSRTQTHTFFVLHDNQMYQYVGATMKEHKAYLDIDLGGAPAPARIKVVFAETQDIENVEFETVKAVKFIENGQVLIKRGEKVYNVQGQIVK